MNLQFKKALFISAHLDDFELGCGGIISKFIGNTNIKFLALAKNRVSSTGKIQEDRNLTEAYKALEKLGGKKDDLEIADIDGQLFPENRQKILEKLLEWKKAFDPDIVFFPSQNDVHQDHPVVCKMALKAFKRCSCIGYELANSSHLFKPNLFIPISEEDIKKKIEAIACYKSQMDLRITTADYFSERVIKSQAIVRGARIGKEYAEAFEIYSMIVKND